jgi:predicted thioesterase
MIALMEAAAVRAVDPHLPAGEASVGIGLDIRHLAATPVGHEVRARAELIAVAGRRLSLKVEAWDEQELIGEGTHERYVVNLARFMTRVKAKTAPD